MNMMQVAKLVVIDDGDNYLLMHRNDHPAFSNDPDLPGGTVESGESVLAAVIREADEEAGLSIDQEAVKKLYEGTEYSVHNMNYFLYVAKLTKRPEVTISWEHSTFDWLTRDQFLNKAKNAKDTYMHMVHDVMLRDNI